MKIRIATSLPSFLRLLFLIVVTLTCRGVAAPYGPNGKTSNWTQPDGTQLDLRVFGDEFYARTETKNGFTVVFNPVTKTYDYAVLSKNGRKLISSGMAVGQGNPRSIPALQALKDPRHLRLPPDVIKTLALSRVMKWDENTKTSQRWNARKIQRNAYEKAKAEGSPELAPPGTTTLGNKVGLTLLIDFEKTPGTVPQAEIVEFCNGDNYTGYGNNGSVKKYFQDNSNKLLTYTNVVTAYVTIPEALHPKSFYNDPNKDAGDQANLLIKDALDILKALPNYATEILPTFDNLTVDGNNEVVAFNVFYAGDNGGVWAAGLWPHSWVLENAGAQELSAGGKKVFKYQITDIGASLELGTFCHENGHMLCDYPDIYDYEYDSVGGAGGFCLMNSGGHGTNPVLINAYLKRASGWTTETNVTSASNFTGTLVSNVGAAGYNKIFRYAKPGTTTEYFLFENRQQAGRDFNIASSGIAVWHIDELGDRDNQSITPNTNHENYECTLVQADNSWHFQRNANDGDPNDLFFKGNPDADYSNTFNDTSTPDARWWNGNKSGCAISSFSTPAASMKVRFGYNLPPNNILVLSPDGGESLATGTTQEVVWYATVTGNVKIELFKDGVLKTLLSASEPNDGSYTWKIPRRFQSGTDYKIKISSVDNPDYTDSSDAEFTIEYHPSLAQSLDTTDLVWTTDGSFDMGWTPQTATAHDKIDAAQSGDIWDWEESNLSTTVNGPCTLEFWWKCSSEESYDFLTLYLDNADLDDPFGLPVPLEQISGERNWVKMSVPIPNAGPNNVRWSYEKDQSVSMGADTVWLDQVVVVPPAPEIGVVDPNAISIVNGATFNCETSEVNVKSGLKRFVVHNTGLLPLRGLAITKGGTNGGDFMVSNPVKNIVRPGESTTFDVWFKPHKEGLKRAVIRIASNDADENPFTITLKGEAQLPEPGIAGILSGLFEPATGIGTGTGNHDILKTTTVTEAAGSRKYLALVVRKEPGTGHLRRTVEVSPNLLDWYSGRNHTTTLRDDETLLKVRDNTPLVPGTKRYIRLKASQQN